MKNGTIETKKYFIKLLSDLAESNFKNIYFGWERPVPRTRCAFHPHPRLMFPVSGCSVLEISDFGDIRNIELKPGDILFLVRGGWVVRTPENNSQLVSVVFLEDFLRMLTVDFKNDEVMEKIWYHTSGRIKQATFFLLQTLTAIAYQKRSPKDNWLLKSLCLQVAYELTDDLPHKYSRSWHTYQRIINYLTDNHSLPINRASVASDLNINESHISRLFQKYSKESFNAMLKRLRMEQAVLILKNSELSVNEIAYECGFSSPDYFIKAFKQYFGTTPLSHRNR